MDALRIAGLFILVLLVIKVLNVVILWVQLLTLTFRRPTVTLVSRSDTPPDLEPLFRYAEGMLRGLGFEYSHSLTVADIVANRPAAEFCHLYFHAATATYAAVSPPELPQGRSALALSFQTYFADGRAIVTVNGIKHFMLPSPERYTFHDHCVMTFAEQWDRHQLTLQQRGTGVERVAFTPERHAAEDGLYRQETLDILADRRWLTPAAGELRRLRAIPALTLALRFVAGKEKQAVAARARGKGKQTLQPCADDAAVVAANVSAFTRLLAFERNRPQSRKMKIVIFTVSVVFFCLAFGARNNWVVLPLILVVLLVHEWGHLLGMKMFGYRDRRLLFMPFLGAAAIGSKEDATAAQRFVVYLLGPVPGLLLGLICLWIPACQTHGVLAEAAGMAFFINYLNLLPITPMDGGRIVETLFLSRFPLAQFIFALVSVALVALAALGTHSGIFLFLTIILAMTLPGRWQSGMAARNIQRRLPPNADEACRLRTIFYTLTHAPFADQPAAARVQAAKSLTSHFSTLPPKAGLMVGGGLLYVLLLLSPAIWAIGTAFAMLGPDAVLGTVSSRHRLRHLEQIHAGPDWDALAKAARDDGARWDIWLDASDWCAGRMQNDKARDYAARAIELGKSFPASDARHIRTLICQAGADGNSAEAYVGYTQALARAESLLGSNDIQVATVLGALAGLTNSPATFDERVQMLQRAIAIQSAMDTNETVVDTQFTFQLATMYEREGEPKAAESLLCRTLEQSHAGEGGPFVAPYVAGALADFYARQGRPDEAEATLTKEMDLWKAKPDHLLVLPELYSHAGWICLDRNDADAALRWFTLAAEAPKTGDALKDRAMAFGQPRRLFDNCYAYMRQGDTNAARRCFEEIRKLSNGKGRLVLNELDSYAVMLQYESAHPGPDMATNDWTHRRLQAHAEVLQQFYEPSTH